VSKTPSLRTSMTSLRRVPREGGREEGGEGGREGGEEEW